MIRILLVVVLVVVAGVAAVALTGDSGHATLVWLGWRIDMTAAAAMLTLLFIGLGGALLCRGGIWGLEAPARSAKTRLEQRRRQGGEALARGFLASAAGDGLEARRLALKAADLADDSPALARLLAAQAAETAGDHAGARAAYNAMLGFPEMRLAGLRGLMVTALAEGDRDAALAHARTANGLPRTAPWAWRALLEDRLAAADWKAALDLVGSALERKVVSPLVAERARAALLAASAAGLEASPEPDHHALALDYALQAVKQQPAFAPGVVMAARLLAVEGKVGRAGGMIEQAWKTHPHPALWLAYRDPRTQETKAARAARLAALAALNPEARESRFLQAELALIGGDGPAARAAAALLDTAHPTARVAGLMARIAYAAGATDEARGWIARAAGAPQEPDWSDLDPEGHAFGYGANDWARLVSTYAETGELLHPRFERGERTLSELPQLPAAYSESAPFIRAAAAPAAPIPIPDDPGPETAPSTDPETDNAPRPARRRLASRPRPAK